MVSTGIVPVPVAVKPETPAEPTAVQANVVPATAEVGVNAEVLAPEQMVCESTVLVTVGVGSTLTVYVVAGPGHPLAVGVMV